MAREGEGEEELHVVGSCAARLARAYLQPSEEPMFVQKFGDLLGYFTRAHFFIFSDKIKKMNCSCVAAYLAVAVLIAGLIVIVWTSRAPRVPQENKPIYTHVIVERDACEERRPVSAWREIGKLLTQTGRTLILEERVHERHRQRYMYRARSTDLHTATHFQVHIDGVNTTDPYSRGAEQVYGGSVSLPEIGETAIVHVTRP